MDITQDEIGVLTEVLESFMHPEPLSVSARRLDLKGPWRLEAVFDTPPDREALTNLFTDIGSAATYTVQPLADQDWVALSNAAMPAITTERFFVRGPHIEPPQDIGARHVLTIEAGLAFGTGHHGSTFGCLSALERLSKRFDPLNVLDLGTGTGLLALAAGRLWPAARIVGTDIDPVAVEVAQDNFHLNQMAPAQMITAPGFRTPALSAQAPFDLIIANILAKPLIFMAQEFAVHLAPGGFGVLAGLLATQANRVLAAYRAAGLRLVRRDQYGEWMTLVIEPPAA